jgi:hypothetical protein
MLKKAFTIASAIILGLLSTIIIGGIGILIIMTIAGISAQLIAIIFLSGGFLLGYRVYKTVLGRGPIDFITAVNASPDLDNLEPSANSNHKKYNIAEYVMAFQKQKNLFTTGGAIRIWGNYTFWGFNDFNKIESIQSPETNQLQITFCNGNILKIWDPQSIVEGHTYFKVLNCRRIEWTPLDDSNKSSCSTSFELQNNGIKVLSQHNIAISKNSFQPGEPAVVLLK